MRLDIKSSSAIDFFKRKYAAEILSGQRKQYTRVSPEYIANANNLTMPEHTLVETTVAIDLPWCEADKMYEHLHYFHDEAHYAQRSDYDAMYAEQSYTYAESIVTQHRAESIVTQHREEERIRRENPAVKEAYEQYLVSLSLCSDGKEMLATSRNK
jgi:hypothetical protein